MVETVKEFLDAMPVAVWWVLVCGFCAWLGSRAGAFEAESRVMERAVLVVEDRCTGCAQLTRVPRRGNVVIRLDGIALPGPEEMRNVARRILAANSAQRGGDDTMAKKKAPKKSAKKAKSRSKAKSRAKSDH